MEGSKINKRKPIKTIKINEMGETSELDENGRDITKLLNILRLSNDMRNKQEKRLKR